MKLSIPVVLLTSVLSSFAVANDYQNEIVEQLLQQEAASDIRDRALMEILGINPANDLIRRENALSDNVTQAQWLFRSSKPELETPGSVSIYAGEGLTIQRLIDLIQDAIGYEINYSKVSPATLDKKVIMSGSNLYIDDILSVLEDETSIDIVRYPKNAGRYILMFE